MVCQRYQGRSSVIGNGQLGDHPLPITFYPLPKTQHVTKPALSALAPNLKSVLISGSSASEGIKLG